MVKNQLANAGDEIHPWIWEDLHYTYIPQLLSPKALEPSCATRSHCKGCLHLEVKYLIVRDRETGLRSL